MVNFEEPDDVTWALQSLLHVMAPLIKQMRCVLNSTGTYLSALDMQPCIYLLYHLIMQ